MDGKFPGIAPQLVASILDLLAALAALPNIGGDRGAGCQPVDLVPIHIAIAAGIRKCCAVHCFKVDCTAQQQ